MLIDIALIILAALLGNLVFSRIGMPGILGMVVAGIILGPSALDVIDPEVLALLEEFKTVALIVILIRAGLGISRETLNRIGGPAIRMGFIPVVFEGGMVAAVAYFLLDLTVFEAGMLGFIVAAVSPAVVVPQMLEFREDGYGHANEVPTVVLAGVILFMIIAVIFYEVSELPEIRSIIPVAALLGVMAIGFVILEKTDDVAHRLAADRCDRDQAARAATLITSALSRSAAQGQPRVSRSRTPRLDRPHPLPSAAAPRLRTRAECRLGP